MAVTISDDAVAEDAAELKIQSISWDSVCEEKEKRKSGWVKTARDAPFYRDMAGLEAIPERAGAKPDRATPAPTKPD